jgi:steroid delta-isomerase-like uncharacterized protein
MTTEDNNKMTLRRFFEAIDLKDVTSLDRFVSTSYVDHNPPPMPGLPSGLDGLKYSFAAFVTAFPDSTHTIEDLFADGDKVVARVVGRGTHQAEFMGAPPSGRQVAMEGIAIYRFENGKIVEKWTKPNGASGAEFDSDKILTDLHRQVQRRRRKLSANG